MNNIKKCILVLTVILVLFVVCSLNSFALDIDFTLADYPSPLYVNDNQWQSYDYIFINGNGDYRYAVVKISPNSSTAYSNLYAMMPWVITNVSSSSPSTSTTPYLFPVFYRSSSFGAWQIFNLNIQVYDTSGTLLYNYSSNNNFQVGTTNYYINVLTLNSPNVATQYKYYSLFDQYSFYILHNNTVGFQAYPTPHLPNAYNCVVDSSFYDHVLEEQGSCSIPDVVKINGVEVYNPNSGSGSGSSISGTVSGSVPDGQGGSQDVNFDVNLDFPDYSGDYNTVTLPENPTISEPDLDSFDGLEWFVNFFNTICTTNSKIFALILLSLTIGVATLILNKKR